MRRLSTVVLALGFVGVAAGILRVLSLVLQRTGVAFDFRTGSIAGPLVGGAVLVLFGLLLRHFSRPTT